MSDPVIAEPVAMSAARYSGRSAMLGDSFEVFLDQGQAGFGGVGVKAYPARGLRGESGLAFVADRVHIPRLQMAEKYVTLQHAGLARLLGRGVIRCADGHERYAFVYDAGLGAAIVNDTGVGGSFGIKPDVVLNAILKPLAGALQELHNADLVHGAIRPGNIFDGASKPLQSAVLGDVLSTPFAASMPMLYLPVQLAIAQPSGRGPGAQTDDMYMLGASLAVLLRTHDPMEGKTDEQILLHKMELGSFSTLMGNERLPANILELLRGLLQDDARLRWSIQDVYEWFDGRRASHRQGLKKLKASRHLMLGNEKILLPSVAAYFAPKFSDDMVRLADSGELRQWVLRSIDDKKLEERIESAIGGATESGRGAGFHDRMVSRLASALDPDFPIFYRQIRAFPEAMGHVLAEAMVSNHDLRAISDLINDQAVKFWLDVQHDMPPDLNIVINKFEQSQQFLKQRSIGYGLERCLYMLCPEAPCLSPILNGFYVGTPEDLCRALNTIALSNHRPEYILDRHMIAFLSVRDRKVIDSYIPDLNSPDKHRYLSGVIQVFGTIQARGKLPPLPGLTKWLCDMAEPLYARFHDRHLRTNLRKRETDIRESGNIALLKDELIHADRLRRDHLEFKAAMHEYTLYTYETQALDYALQDKDRFGIQAGREIAALVAGVVMALAVAGLILIRIQHGGGGGTW